MFSHLCGAGARPVPTWHDLAMVNDSRDGLRQLLRELDDPVHMEHPADFDRKATANRFDELVARLEVAFDSQCLTDAGIHVQDASHYGQALVPGEATTTGSDLFVRISNFFPLAVFGLARPGVYTDEELFELCDRTDRERVEGALRSSGYIIAPETVLWERYDGRSEWLRRESGSRVPSWFTRFFDYL